MNYVIFKLVQPSGLKEIIEESYEQKTVYRDVLQELDVPEVEDLHDSIESAESEIIAKKHLLKSKRLAIIPVVSVSWDGEIN